MSQPVAPAGRPRAGRHLGARLGGRLLLTASGPEANDPRCGGNPPSLGAATGWVRRAAASCLARQWQCVEPRLAIPVRNALHIDGAMIGTFPERIDAGPELCAGGETRRILFCRLTPNRPGFWMQPARLREMPCRLLALCLCAKALGRAGNARAPGPRPRRGSAAGRGRAQHRRRIRSPLPSHPVANRGHVGLLGAITLAPFARATFAW